MNLLRRYAWILLLPGLLLNIVSCGEDGLLGRYLSSAAIELGSSVVVFSEYALHLDGNVHTIYKDSQEQELTIRSARSSVDDSHTIQWSLQSEEGEDEPQGISIEEDIGDEEEVRVLVTRPGRYVLNAKILDEFGDLVAFDSRPIHYKDERRIFVSEQGGGRYDGSSWNNAVDGQNFLQEVIDAAERYMENRSGVFTIWLQEGRYVPPLREKFANEQDRAYRLGNKVQIFGGFSGIEQELSERNWQAHPSVLTGDLSSGDTEKAYHVFYHPASLNLDRSAVLDGVYITEGRADGDGAHRYGGAMYNEEASPTLRNIVFHDNYAAFDGGAVYNIRSSPLFEGLRFHRNSSQMRGGAVHNGEGSRPVFANVLFRENLGLLGGGAVHNDGAVVLFANAVFLFNAAPGPDGAWGGALYNNGASVVTLIHASFHGNTATGGGAAIANFAQSDLQIYNSVIWDNRNAATGSIDAVYNSTSRTRYTHSLVEYLIQGGVWNDDLGENLGGNVSLDPQFVSPGAWNSSWTMEQLDRVDLRPSPDSPLRAAASPSIPGDSTPRDLLSRDIEGRERPESASIGAYE